MSADEIILFGEDLPSGKVYSLSLIDFKYSIVNGLGAAFSCGYAVEVFFVKENRCGLVAVFSDGNVCGLFCCNKIVVLNEASYDVRCATWLFKKRFLLKKNGDVLIDVDYKCRNEQFDILASIGKKLSDPLRSLYFSQHAKFLICHDPVERSRIDACNAKNIHDARKARRKLMGLMDRLRDIFLYGV